MGLQQSTVAIGLQTEHHGAQAGVSDWLTNVHCRPRTVGAQQIQKLSTQVECAVGKRVSGKCDLQSSCIDYKLNKVDGFDMDTRTQHVHI